MRVLIVGCGYIGLPLGAELARQGHDVFGLRRSLTAAADLKAVGINPLAADITQRSTLDSLPAGFDWVVNCAASGGGDLADYQQIYVEGNRNLLQWLSLSPVKKFVYTGSTSVYGQNDGSLVTEDSPTTPMAETSVVLLEAENLLLAGAAKKFPAVILRLAGIYGPNRGHSFKQFLRGEARIEGDGSRYLNMIHRTDAVHAVIAALERGNPGRIYNVVDDEPVQQIAFFRWVAAELEKPLPATVPADATAWRRRGVTNKRISNARFKGELGFQYQFPDFRAGYAPEVQRHLLRPNILFYFRAANLNGAIPAFLSPNPHHFHKIGNEDFAVPDFAGFRGGGDRLDRRIFLRVRDDQFNLVLRQKIHRVFAAAINLGMSVLPAKPLDFRDGHPLDADAVQRLFDLV